MSLRSQPLHYNPPQEDLKILYQDDDLLVLSKPAGLLSVPGKDPSKADCLETRAKTAYPNALLVHRLDMATSGVMVMAMNKKAQANLGSQFERRVTEKTYIARVYGTVDGDSGTVNLPLRCDWPNRPLQMVCYTDGKEAITEWRVLERSLYNDVPTTLMELTPKTGRSHQLRVHMKALGTQEPDKTNPDESLDGLTGHPILGDEFYAHDAALAASPRLMLHAQSLTIYHPTKSEQVTFEDKAVF